MKTLNSKIKNLKTRFKIAVLKHSIGITMWLDHEDCAEGLVNFHEKKIAKIKDDKIRLDETLTQAKDRILELNKEIKNAR